jgi:hypothetical protein
MQKKETKRQGKFENPKGLVLGNLKTLNLLKMYIFKNKLKTPCQEYV